MNILPDFFVNAAAVVNESLAELAQDLGFLTLFFLGSLIVRRAKWQKKQQRATKKAGLCQNLKLAAPAPANAETQILTLLKQNEFMRALYIYRSCERREIFQFGEATFLAFVEQVGKPDMAKHFFDDMRQAGVVPSLNFWQKALTAMSGRKMFISCLAAYSVFDKDIPIDRVVLACLVNAALTVGDTQCAAALLRQQSAKVELDPKDNILFFWTYHALGDVDAAETIFRTLGSKVTSPMFNVLLLTCVDAKQPERSLRLLQEAHALEKAWSAQADDGQQCLVDHMSYRTVIKGFAEASNLECAVKLMDEMREVGHIPDDVILTHMLEACRRLGRHWLGKRLFQQAVDDGVSLSSFTLLAIVKLHGRAGAHQEACNLVAGWEAAHGFKPSVIHYTCIISGCIRGKKNNQAWSTYKFMMANGVQPDAHTLCTLLPSTVATCEWDRTMEVVRGSSVKVRQQLGVDFLNRAFMEMKESDAHNKNAIELQELMSEAGISLEAKGTQMCTSWHRQARIRS
jgi:pentatricopeptide repeat protein